MPAESTHTEQVLVVMNGARPADWALPVPTTAQGRSCLASRLSHCWSRARAAAWRAPSSPLTPWPAWCCSGAQLPQLPCAAGGGRKHNARARPGLPDGQHHSRAHGRQAGHQHPHHRLGALPPNPCVVAMRAGKLGTNTLTISSVRNPKGFWGPCFSNSTPRSPQQGPGAACTMERALMAMIPLPYVRCMCAPASTVWNPEAAAPP